MIKLQDFARQMGVTDRAVQKHLKKYAAELEGLYQRKGPNGTWLTEEACEILRNKMRQQPIAVADAESNREKAELRTENERLHRELEAALKVNSMLSQWQADNSLLIAGAEQNKLLLESTKAELDQERKAHAEDNAAKDQIIASKDAEILEVRENAQQAVQDWQDAIQREEDQKQRADAAEAKLDEIKHMSRLKRFFWNG